jgi:hypothetical protein
LLFANQSHFIRNAQQWQQLVTQQRQQAEGEKQLLHAFINKSMFDILMEQETLLLNLKFPRFHIGAVQCIENYYLKTIGGNQLFLSFLFVSYSSYDGDIIDQQTAENLIASQQKILCAALSLRIHQPSVSHHKLPSSNQNQMQYTHQHQHQHQQSNEGQQLQSQSVLHDSSHSLIQSMQSMQSMSDIDTQQLSGLQSEQQLGSHLPPHLQLRGNNPIDDPAGNSNATVDTNSDSASVDDFDNNSQNTPTSPYGTNQRRKSKRRRSLISSSQYEYYGGTTVSSYNLADLAQLSPTINAQDGTNDQVNQMDVDVTNSTTTLFQPNMILNQQQMDSQSSALLQELASKMIG